MLLIETESFKEIDIEKTLKILSQDQINSLHQKSHKKIYWKCSKNHSYIQVISKHTSGHNCPYCSGHKVLKGFNDLLTLFPDLCKEWDYELNTIKPDEISSKSHKKVYWKCNKNHSWETPVYSRTNGNNCPYCSRQRLLKGYNDLQSKFPDIAKEWDFEKNFSEYGLKPDEVVFGSKKKVYWKCNKGHSWECSITSRTGKRKSGCPQCNNQTSFGEQCIYYYLLPYNAKNRFKLDNMEVDIYLPKNNIKSNYTSIGPDKDIGIEFNGLFWHKDRKEKDLIKELKLSSKIKMYYICESTKNEIIDNKIYFDCKHKYNLNLELAIKTLFNILNLNIDVNIKRDEQLIYNHINIKEKENSLAYKFPELLKEWNYDKNVINPNNISPGSGKKVYWKCSKGHEWEAIIQLRVGQKSGCPICSNKKVLKGYNDLLTLFPDICKEWDYELNFSEYGLKPDEVTRGSHKTVYWKCNKGHSWAVPIYFRTRPYINSSCPICKK